MLCFCVDGLRLSTQKTRLFKEPVDAELGFNFETNPRFGIAEMKKSSKVLG
jgi:hypothetical protein